MSLSFPLGKLHIACQQPYPCCIWEDEGSLGLRRVQPGAIVNVITKQTPFWVMSQVIGAPQPLGTVKAATTPHGMQSTTLSSKLLKLVVQRCDFFVKLSSAGINGTPCKVSGGMACKAHCSHLSINLASLKSHCPQALTRASYHEIDQHSVGCLASNHVEFPEDSFEDPIIKRCAPS
jgi:hypothetical protein